MNNRLRDDIRDWKPTKAKAQLDLSDLLKKDVGIFVSLIGTVLIEPATLQEHLRLFRLLYTVNTKEEAEALRDLLCFQTQGGNWRLYWVRRTGKFVPGSGPTFSPEHSEWISTHLNRCWHRYINPERKKSKPKVAT